MARLGNIFNIFVTMASRVMALTPVPKNIQSTVQGE